MIATRHSLAAPARSIGRPSLKAPALTNLSNCSVASCRRRKLQQDLRGDPLARVANLLRHFTSGIELLPFDSVYSQASRKTSHDLGKVNRLRHSESVGGTPSTG